MKPSPDEMRRRRGWLYSALLAAASDAEAGAGEGPALPVIQNLEIHARPEDLVSIGQGNPIASWADASGSGNTLTAAGGARPTVSAPSAIHGFMGADFDGVGNYLTSAGPAPSSQPWYFAFALEVDTNAAYYLLDDTSGTNPSIASTVGTAGPRFNQTYSSSIAIGPADEPTIGQDYLIEFIGDGANSSIRVNGTEVVTGNVGVAGFAGVGFRVGARILNSGYYNGTMYEFIAANSHPDAATLSEIAAYFQGKYS